MNVRRTGTIVNVVDDFSPPPSQPDPVAVVPGAAGRSGAGPSPHVLARLEALDRRIAADLRRVLPAETRELRGSHGRILDLISESGTRPSTLAGGAWITKQAVGKRLRELAERGLITQVADPADRRAVLVRRTPAGDRVRRAAVAAIAAMEEEWAADVGRERYATFRAVLDELGVRRTDPTG